VSEQTSPPRETIIRAVSPALEFRDASESDLEEGHIGLLRILFSPVNQWTEIKSVWEGNFMERFAPGAWKKTISERISKILPLFQHGMDPQAGEKPLGPIRLLEENERGGYAEVPLLDTSYNRDLLPGLKAGLYGASHRFSVMREERNDHPDQSADNPHGLPERTIKEARLFEFGPVTFPAYAGATAGVRSLTDEFLMSCFRSDPDRLREMFDRATALDEDETAERKLTVPVTSDADVAAALESESTAPSESDAETPDASHLTDERREDKPPTRRPIYGTRRKETSKPWLLGPSKSTKRS